MTALKDKIQDALDEGRILILGAQIIMGILYRAVFEPGYNRLPVLSREMTLGALGLVTIAFGLLMLLVAYHRIAERGLHHENYHIFVTSVMKITLLPFALSLGLTVYVAVAKLTGPVPAVFSGFLAVLTAVFCWYGVAMIRHQKMPSNGLTSGASRPGENEREDMVDEHTKLQDKIRNVLTEARMVLPGAQALLGFQFITMVLDDFDKLPESSKWVHLVSLLLTALSTLLLMMPAAYHRLAERGENTEEFHRFAGRAVLASMVPLALGISGDFFVVVRKVTESTAFATGAAGLLLGFFYGLWFGFTISRRRRSEQMG
jgi:hypothetical protein